MGSEWYFHRGMGGPLEVRGSRGCGRTGFRSIGSGAGTIDPSMGEASGLGGVGHPVGWTSGGLRYVMLRSRTSGGLRYVMLRRESRGVVGESAQKLSVHLPTPSILMRY